MVLRTIAGRRVLVLRIILVCHSKAFWKTLGQPVQLQNFSAQARFLGLKAKALVFLKLFVGNQLLVALDSRLCLGSPRARAPQKPVALKAQDGLDAAVGVFGDFNFFFFLFQILGIISVVEREPPAFQLVNVGANAVQKISVVSDHKNGAASVP